jgi:hypothetical protein
MDRRARLLVHAVGGFTPPRRSAADDESMLRRHLMPAFGGLLLREISVEGIERYKIDHAALSPKSFELAWLDLETRTLHLGIALAWSAPAASGPTR